MKKNFNEILASTSERFNFHLRLPRANIDWLYCLHKINLMWEFRVRSWAKKIVCWPSELSDYLVRWNLIGFWSRDVRPPDLKGRWDGGSPYFPFRFSALRFRALRFWASDFGLRNFGLAILGLRFWALKFSGRKFALGYIWQHRMSHLFQSDFFPLIVQKR